MPDKDDGLVGTAERRKMSLVDVAKRCRGVILSDGKVWDGSERREDEKGNITKPSGNKPVPKEKNPCDFFG